MTKNGLSECLTMTVAEQGSFVCSEVVGGVLVGGVYQHWPIRNWARDILVRGQLRGRRLHCPR